MAPQPILTTALARQGLWSWPWPVANALCTVCRSRGINLKDNYNNYNYNRPRRLFLHGSSVRAQPSHIRLPKWKEKNFTPDPLTRPVGLPNPPNAGENTGIDTRTWRQRLRDFVSHESHIQARNRMSVITIPSFTLIQFLP
jgi:hypothetical protein